MRPRGSPSSGSEWLRLAGVLVFAALLSLIGVNIASSIEPGGSGPSSPVAEATTTSTTLTTTTTAALSSVVDEEPATTTTASPEPGSISLSRQQVDFGEDDSSRQLEVIHEGGGSAQWSLTVDHPAVSATPSEGELAPGDSVAVTLNLDRSQIEEGDLETSMTISWDAGEVQVPVLAVLADNPIIHKPKASPGSVEVSSGESCSPTRTTISARVRDTSELDQVIARWSPDGSVTRETAMKPVGNDMYEGLIGPFEEPRTDSVKVIAFDSLGNAGGATISVTVTACS